MTTKIVTPNRLKVAVDKIIALLSGKVNKTGDETISGIKTFDAPANVNGTEQTTAKFKTSNGGAVVIGKEGGNSGAMIRIEQVDGTPRLKFRASATAGAMVWEQPEQGARLYFDIGLKGSDYKRISLPSSAGTLALKSETDKKMDKPTVVTGTLAAGSTSITLSNSAITTSSIVDIYTDKYGVNPTDVTVSAGKVVLTFESQSSAVNIRIEVK